MQSLLSNPLQLHALRTVLGLQTHPAVPAQEPHPAEHGSALAAAAAPPSSAGAAPPSAGTGAAPEAAAAAGGQQPPGGAPGAVTDDPPSYDVARDIMDGAGSYASAFSSDSAVVRISAKLFNVTPADLPADLRERLVGWMGSAPLGVEGCIRPGCVMLTLSTLVPAAVAEAAAAAPDAGALHALLAGLLAPDADAFWRRGVMMLQLGSAVGVLSHGRIASLACYEGSAADAARVPVLARASPLCLAAAAGSAGGATLRLSGSWLDGPDCQVVARCGGASLRVSPAAAKTEGGGQAAALSVSVAAPASVAGAALLWVEVSKGAFLSEAQPVLVVQEAALAEEVAQLGELAEGQLSAAQRTSLLVDLSLVLQHIHAGANSCGSGAHAGTGAGSGGGLRHAPGLSHHAIADKARRLLAFAADRGLAALAAAVLPLASAACDCAADIVAAIHASTAQDGLSLLHRAVRSGSLPLVTGMLAWGRLHGYQWDIDWGGPLGLTPLHLSALLDDGGAITLALLDELELRQAGGSSGGGGAAAGMGAGDGAAAGGEDEATHSACQVAACAGGCAAAACGAAPTGCALTTCSSHDGVTPFHLAFQMGHWSLDRVLAATMASQRVSRVVEQPLPSAWDLLRAAAAAYSGGSSGGAAKGAEGGKKGGSGGGARASRDLDACLNCQSTTPPLLLSIKAHCSGCGQRQPCISSGAAPPPAAAGIACKAPACGGAGGCTDACNSGCKSALRLPPCAAGAVGEGAVPPAKRRRASGGKRAQAAAMGDWRQSLSAAELCAHEGRVLSVAAVCQACHANRIMEVA